MNPDKLAELDDWLRESDQRNFAAVVIRNGYIRARKRARLGSTDEL